MQIRWKSDEIPLKFVANVDEIQPKVDENLNENGRKSHENFTKSWWDGSKS